MITEFIKNILILASISVIASEYLSKITKAKNFVSQIQSWIVAAVVAFVANFLGFGFTDITWFTTLIYGVFVGLVSNGVFEIPVVKKFLEIIKARIVI